MNQIKIVVCSLDLAKQLPGVQNDSPVMNTPGSFDSPVVNTTGESQFPYDECTGDLTLVFFEQRSEHVYKKILNTVSTKKTRIFRKIFSFLNST
jgi:hypothetical protein